MAAIVGQEKLKTALILTVIDPGIGGVLVTGPKGTGKSIAIRALADLLPEIEVVDGCPFNCSPSDPTNMCANCRSLTESGKPPPARLRRMRILQIPLGATEDRVIGSLNVDKATKEGLKALEPGLLAEANQGILYIDEVNLLPDHITDDILDAAASGWNIVERESVSVSHPSRFILIGSMNPEEGELRPQILDRFGIHVKTENITDLQERLEVVKRNEEYSQNPEAFVARFKPQQHKLKEKITEARRLLPKVRISPPMIESIAYICKELKVDGHRPDITAVRASKALAAYRGRTAVEPQDVLLATDMALSHRTRSSGMNPPPEPEEIKEVLNDTPLGKAIRKLEGRRSLKEVLRSIGLMRTLRKLGLAMRLRGLLIVSITYIFLYLALLSCINAMEALLLRRPPQSHLTSLEGAISLGASAVLTFLLMRRRPKERVEVPILDMGKLVLETDRRLEAEYIVEGEGKYRPIPATVMLKPEFEVHLEGGTKIPKEDRVGSMKISPIDEGYQRRKGGSAGLDGKRYQTGRKAKTISSATRGRYVWHGVPREKPWDLALAPTIRVAATRQRRRERGELAVKIEPEDIRVKRREYRPPYVIVLLVDMSYSMISSMRNLARAIFSLHHTVFRRKDRVGLVVFKGSDAYVLQQPTTNLELVAKKLLSVGASDYTPMAAGLLKAYRVLRLERCKNRDAIRVLIVISDGIVNVPIPNPLSWASRKRFMIESQADTIDVARLIAKDEVRTIIINTSHNLEPHHPSLPKAKQERRVLWYTPTELMMRLAEITKGMYYGLNIAGEAVPVRVAAGTKIGDRYYIRTS